MSGTHKHDAPSRQNEGSSIRLQVGQGVTIRYRGLQPRQPCMWLRTWVREPHIWPENKIEFNRILKRYHSWSVQDRSKRSENLQDQNNRRIKKREKELAKQRISNGPDVLRWDHRMDEFDEERLEEQRQALDSVIGGLSGRIRLMKGQDCILEGASGMIEYYHSHSVPDHGSFKSSVVSVHPQPVTYMRPPVDQQISTINYTYNFRPSDLCMFYDVGPMATPLMSPTLNPCDPFHIGASWNFNAWTSMDRWMFCDAETKSFDEIEAANAGGPHASSSTICERDGSIFTCDCEEAIEEIDQKNSISVENPGIHVQFDRDLGVLREFGSASRSVARPDSHSYPMTCYGSPYNETLNDTTRIDYLIGYIGSTLNAIRLEKLGALSWFKVVHDHQVWRLVTSIWLHNNSTHLLENMLMLLYISIGIEQQYGVQQLKKFYPLS
ncbi:hypothetical protein Sjap_002027 [Stephania japonica]|uniref:RHOMBOID-like protein n=1 Tax=Stephania japonica TaxID=461633 RepID=A0AAP0KNC8_9MAGN